MRYFASIFVFCTLLYPAFTQTTKPKPAGTLAAVKKATPPKKTTAVKPASAKPKATPTPKKTPDENEVYGKAIAVADVDERIKSLRKFLKDFPKSEKRLQVTELLVTTQAAAGNEKLQANDLESAVRLMTGAAKDAPKPLPDQLFTDTLSKFLPSLFWRGERVAAFEIARILEEKSDVNTGQLLAIANFYMSVENGAEAKRVAGEAIKLEPNSSAAYQTLGLANRIDFQLDESAAAYAKALELEPDSVSARRGLAETKRSLGRSDEAAALYREILLMDDAYLPARTGLVLSLFDSGKRADAEAELARTLEANPGNVMLLAGAAYWYAANNEGQKAIEYAQKAIGSDPRFIWSHIALARGLMAEQRPLDAERTLLAARRYGNFPTLEYEIASARSMAGFYREAAEELSKSFVIKDGMMSTKLGGRIDKESADFIELISLERQASIFAPKAADSPENARKLRGLLLLTTKLAANEPDTTAIAKAAEEFTNGTDGMRVHRLLFTVKELVDHKKELSKALELARAAVGQDEAGLDVPTAAAAILADELYDSRRLAISRDEYIRVPDIPRQTLSAILRGRIEELNGWALYQTSSPAEAAIRLKRAVSVLPSDSAWWRSSMWRLGAALELAGKDAEALDAYVKYYKSSQPDVVKYSIIQALYKRINGSTDGLETKIGPTPSSPVSADTVAQKIEPTASPDAAPSPSGSPVSERSIGEVPGLATTPTPLVVATKPEPTPETSPEPTPVKTEPTPEPSPDPTPVKTEPTPEPSPDPTPVKTEPTPEPSPDPTPAKTEPTPEPSPERTPEKIEPTPEPTPGKTEPMPEGSPPPTPDDSKVPVVAKPISKSPDEKPAENKEPAAAKQDVTTKPLFPPVIITIPVPQTGGKPAKADEPKNEPTDSPKEKTDPVEAKPIEPKPVEKREDVTETHVDGRPRVVESQPAEQPPPCKLTLSEEGLALRNSGGDLAVIVGTEDDSDVTGIEAISSSPVDVDVRLEPISGIRGRALFVIRSISAKAGLYQITFKLPCGKKELMVTVR